MIKTRPGQRVCRRRKRDTIVRDHSFLEKFSEPSLEDMTPLQYFLKFITTELLDIVAEQTNISNFQIILKSIETNHAEIMSLIGTSIKMGILQLPSYNLYCSQELHCPRIGDVMPPNRYHELLRYLHFVNNDSIIAQDTLAKTCPLILIKWDKILKNIYQLASKSFLWKQSICLPDKRIPKSKKVGVQKSCFPWHLWFYL